MPFSAVYFHSHKSEPKATDCYEDIVRTVTYLYAMQAASKALKEREAALVTLHAIETDLEKRRHTIVAIEEEGQKVNLLKLYSDHIFLHAMTEDAHVPECAKMYGRAKMADLKVKYLCILRMAVGLTVPLLQFLHVRQAASELAGSTHFSCKPVCTNNKSRAQRQMPLGDHCSRVYAIQVFGGDKAKLRKTDNLKNEVAGLEAAVQAASQEYDRVKLRNTQVCLHTNPCTHVHVYNQHHHQVFCLHFC